MKSALALLVVVAVTAQPLVGQGLEGVWKPVLVVVDSGPDAGRHTADVQPGLIIFSGRYYSATFVPGFTSRPIPSDSATDEELGQAFLRFVANAGTYQRRDTVITFSPTVAKHPRVMSGTFTIPARLQGDTLWVRGRAQRAAWVRVNQE